jgi:hypothetical protein
MIAKNEKRVNGKAIVKEESLPPFLETHFDFSV